MLWAGGRHEEGILWTTTNLICNPDMFCSVFTERPSIRPSITTHPQGHILREGETVSLSCNATGNPEPTISWTRNGFPVNTRSNSSISFSEDKKLLTITTVNRTDSGEYRCVANNSIGNDTSNVATLDVQCKYSIFLETFLERYLQCCYTGYSVQVIDQDRTMLSLGLQVLEKLLTHFGYGTKRANRDQRLLSICFLSFNRLTS